MDKYNRHKHVKTKTNLNQMKIQNIKLSEISNDYSKNVRFENNYGNIQELADNIQAKGLLVPLQVEKTETGYSLISGHRRFAALTLLIERGLYTESSLIPCTIAAYQNELERAAGKLLANDGQPLTPDEWAAEIGRLAESIKDSNPKFIQEIAVTLGKSEAYVQSLYSTWTKLNNAAKQVIQTGKVGMTLAILITKKAESDQLASIGVQLAAAAKDKVKESGQTVSDSTIAEAVNITSSKVIAEAKQGNSMTGEAIGADLLANIQMVTGAKKAGTEAKKQAQTGNVNLQTYITNLIDNLESNSLAICILEQVLIAHKNNLSISELTNLISKIK